MAHARSMLVSLCTLLALGGCAVAAVPGVEPGSGGVSAQRGKWEAQRLDDYRFTVARTCRCTDEARQPAVVEVRGDRVVKVTSVGTGRELDPGLGFTVDELFDRIAAAERSGSAPAVQYHPRRGYPTRATVGTPENDAGVEYSLSSLEPVR